MSKSGSKGIEYNGVNVLSQEKYLPLDLKCVPDTSGLHVQIKVLLT